MTLVIKPEDHAIVDKAKKLFHSLSSTKQIPDRGEAGREQWIYAYCLAYKDCLEDNKTWLLLGKSHSIEEKQIDDYRITLRTLIHLGGDTYKYGTMYEPGTMEVFNIQKYAEWLKNKIVEFDKKNRNA